MPEDFDRLIWITDGHDAAKLFNNKAPLVTHHRDQLQQLNAARPKALDDYRQRDGERERARSEAVVKQRQRLLTQTNPQLRSYSSKGHKALKNGGVFFRIYRRLLR